MGSASFTGDGEMKDRLLRLAREYPKRIPGALYRRGEAIMTDSKQNYVPVDDGPLRASGFVDKPKQTGTSVSVTLGFGGPAAVHAIVVHEHPSGFDPPSWQGKQVTFQPSGRGPKYLEKPLLEASRTMAADLAADLSLD